MDTTEDLPRFGYISCAALSDVGRKRKNNEDSHGEWPEAGVFCVADGMGGARDGEVASRIVVEHLSMSLKNWAKYSPPISLPDRIKLVDMILDAASKWIFDYAETHDAKGCGTTFVGVVFDPADAASAVAMHAGDSRLYRIRGRRILQITRDHSVANMAGVKNEAELDPAFRNMILRAVGISETVELERTQFDVAAGDWIVICSDGLSKMVDDSSIRKIVRGAKGEAEAAQALIDEANRRGGRDNVTVVVLHVGSLPGAGEVSAPLGGDKLAALLVGEEDKSARATDSEFTMPTTVTDDGGDAGGAAKVHGADGDWLADADSEEVNVGETPAATQETGEAGGAVLQAGPAAEQSEAPCEASVRVLEKKKFYKKGWFTGGAMGILALLVGVSVAELSRNGRGSKAGDFDDARIARVANERIGRETEAARIAEERRKAEEADRIAREEAERKVREAEAARIAEEKRKAEEAERIAREEAERKVREAEAARIAEEKRKAEEAERIAREEAERKAREEEAARIAEKKRKAEEAERIAREETERKAREAEEARIAEEKRKAEEAERIAEEKRKAEEAERIARREAERKAREAEEARLAEEKRKAEAERIARQEAERKAEAERIALAIKEHAKFISRRWDEVNVERKILEGEYLTKLLGHVKDGGDDFVKASRYPESFKKEVELFKWALGYVLDASISIDIDTQKKLKSWRRTLEGGVK